MNEHLTCSGRERLPREYQAEDPPHQEELPDGRRTEFLKTHTVTTTDCDASKDMRLEQQAPGWNQFLEEYLARHKPDVLDIDPNVKGAKRNIRRLLAEMLHEAIDAAVDDIDAAFQTRQQDPSPRQHGSELICLAPKSTSKACTISMLNEADGDIEPLTGHMSCDEQPKPTADTKRLQTLRDMVKREMDELAEFAKEAIDDAL